MLFLYLRPGSHNSQEGAAERLDESVDLLRRADFRSILLRDDTAYSQTKFIDGWDDNCVEFISGMQAAESLVTTAGSSKESDWRLFERDPRYEISKRAKEGGGRASPPAAVGVRGPIFCR